MPQRIAGILLAAGNSSRMAGTRGPKQLLQFQGQSLLHRAATTALAASLNPLIVVLGDPNPAIQNELANLPLQITHNENWPRGMGASIHAAMQTLTPFQPLDALLITLCDQPLITPDHLRQLITAHRTHPTLPIAAAYNQTLGVPALFPASLFQELQNLPEHAGAKSILRNHPVHQIPIPEAATDIDTPEAYQALLSHSPGLARGNLPKNS
jgi:molybdenum cofactor cytidylyltransferase